MQIIQKAGYRGECFKSKIQEKILWWMLLQTRFFAFLQYMLVKLQPERKVLASGIR